MAIETKNHACRRDSIKNLSTKEQTYDNGQGGTLSIRKKTKTKTKGGNLLTSTNNVFNKKTIPASFLKVSNSTPLISENQAGFMNQLGLKPMDSGSIELLDLPTMVIDILAPCFISEGGN
tara:strand:+ start:208 stop:567 length:360 start_codon:yes stop_codon:yes gene_type:complete